MNKVVLATGKVTHLACGLMNASLVIADDENVYFTEDSRNGDYVSRMPVNGGAITPTIGGLTGISGIAMDENDVYLPGNNGILAFSKATLELRVIPIKIEDPVSRIAVDATNVYWGGLDGIYRAPKGGNATGGPGTTLLARGPAGDFGLALDDEYIYWNDSFGIERVRKDIAGGTDASSELLAIDGNGARGLFLDESFVYWASSGGLIVKLPKGGGTPTLLAARFRADPVLVGVDDKYVYWFEQLSDKSAILKVAK
jgi:hypothetical protein